MDPYRMMNASVFMGKEAMYQYFMEYVYPSCLAAEGATTLPHDTLRFAAHLILLLRCSFPDDMALPEDEMLMVVQAYIQSLVEQRHLPLVALYTSLLPPEMLIDTYVSFLLEVDEEEERQMTLDLARENFSDGLDLLILRRVVRSIIDEPGGDGSDELGNKDHGCLLIVK